VNIDPWKILNRPVRMIDEQVVNNHVAGQIFLVSGAGGSIGSEICRQLVRFGARDLILVENCEFNLYRIDLELRGIAAATNSRVKIQPVLQDAGNSEFMRDLVRKTNPSAILHAAAFKHVPLVEANPLAGIQNNLRSTLTLAEAAQDFAVPAFLLISSDKAVNPTNVMGMTKRWCERIIQAHAVVPGSRTRFGAVRFGNVLASSGSVIPRFLEQLSNGEPLTVTHPEVTRYFMLVPEAVGLVLQASAMASGGEIFVLDMGEPVRIVELAERLIKATGRIPHEEVPIVFTGLRPGEKMYEELILDGDETATKHEGIFIARPEAVNPVEVMSGVRDLLERSKRRDLSGSLELLRSVVSGSTAHSGPNRNAG
jgi:FlaA1/EpsC-like NDP-sugar epimerase